MSSTTDRERARIAGRLAVVTGASRGIGRAITQALHDAGARVVLLGRDEQALSATVERLGGAERAAAFAVDFAQPADVAATARAVQREAGAVDILVNNAALFFVRPAHETDLADFERTLAINLSAHFALVREIVPGMRRRRTGHVVSIGSVADHTPLRGNAAYAASKYGLRGLHEVLREELRGSGVRATLISPARVDTRIWDDITVSADTTPLEQGMLAASDVAEAVMYALTRDPTVNVDETRLSRS